MLTGKCKQDFEKWYLKLVHNYLKEQVIKEFYECEPSMQYGVYVDFFDSVGIHIVMQPYIGGGDDVYYWNITYRRDFVESFYEPKLDNGDIYYDNTRAEARTKAIEKANEIYNTNV